MNKKRAMIFDICMVLGAMIFSALILLYFIINPEGHTMERPEDYKGRDAFFKVENDYFSHLLIFPESGSDELQIEKYYYKDAVLPFDNAYDIYLEYSLEAKEYEAEKKRIRELSLSYKKQQNKVIKVEGASSYDMYVTSWYEMRAYEYALFDDENHKIVCIYSQLGDPNGSAVPEKYHVDVDVVTKAVSKEYSMYYFKTGGGMDMPER